MTIDCVVNDTFNRIPALYSTIGALQNRTHKNLVFVENMKTVQTNFTFFLYLNYNEFNHPCFYANFSLN